LDVSQKLTAIGVVDETGRRLWRGQCATNPEQIERTVRGHAGEDAHVRLKAGPSARVPLVGMTTWLSNHIRGVLKTFGLAPIVRPTLAA